MSHSFHEIPELNRAELRNFGLVTGAILALLFGLFFPWLLEKPIPSWPWVVAAVLGAWGLIAPISLRPVYRTWMKFGLLLSKITTPIVLGIVFYLVVMPMGLVMRLFGHDPMARRFDDDAASYRIKHDKAPKKSLERPF
jgi:hypothetical protein